MMKIYLVETVLYNAYYSLIILNGEEFDESDLGQTIIEKK